MPKHRSKIAHWSGATENRAEAVFPKGDFKGNPKRLMSLQITLHELVKTYCVVLVIVQSPIGEKVRDKIGLAVDA